MHNAVRGSDLVLSKDFPQEVKTVHSSLTDQVLTNSHLGILPDGTLYVMNYNSPENLIKRSLEEEVKEQIQEGMLSKEDMFSLLKVLEQTSNIIRASL